MDRGFAVRAAAQPPEWKVFKIDNGLGGPLEGFGDSHAFLHSAKSRDR